MYVAPRFMLTILEILIDYSNFKITLCMQEKNDSLWPWYYFAPLNFATLYRIEKKIFEEYPHAHN